MNPWILWLIKSIGGVVLRDFMLVFYERCNRSGLWKKSALKMVKYAISGQNRRPVSVPLDRYRYPFGAVPVPLM